MMNTFSASSPGRMDVMGGIADYSGSLVLQMPIHNRTTVTVKLRNDYQCKLSSRLIEGEFHAEFDYRKVSSANYAAANQILNQDKEASWIAYVLGCAIVLQKEKGIDFRGADFTVESQVPLGKGVSSSAAIEVATMKALSQAFQISFKGTEQAILAQQVENLIVGAPCGLMDQLASSFAIPDELLPIICQPDILQPSIKIPEPIKFIGIDSGVRHAISGASYSDVRCSAFMGYSIIAQKLGASVEDIIQARNSGDWKKLPYKGYLCNITSAEFNNSFRSLLPKQISGGEFIKKYTNTTDSVTSINANVEYSILDCTLHPIYENERVSRFKTIISNFKNNNQELKELGRLMNQSHESYSTCGLGSDRTNEIVEIAKQFESAGILGAKITGGGSGGTVCLLAIGDNGIQSAKKIHQMMESKYKTKLAYFD